MEITSVTIVPGTFASFAKGIVVPPYFKPFGVYMFLIFLKLIDNINNASFKQFITRHILIYDSFLEILRFKFVSNEISSHEIPIIENW